MSDQKFLFLGDSITDAGHLWEEDIRALGQGYVRKISESPDFRGAHLVNRGQDGFTAPNLLRLLKTMKDLESFDVITILIGVNDLCVASEADPAFIRDSYAGAMREIFTRIRACFHKKLLILEPFVFTVVAEHIRWLPDLEEEMHILQSLCEEFDALYIPTMAAFTAVVEESSPWDYTVDGIHLTDKGNRLLAELWMAGGRG